MKFKVGDKVKLNPNLEGDENFTYGIGNVSHGEIGAIAEINTDGDIYVDFPNQKGWIGLEEELVFATIEIGDTVKINKNITLGDIEENYFNGCQIHTMKFLQEASYSHFEKEYKVTDVAERYIQVNDLDNLINIKLFEVVKRKEEVKEMTIEEISKALGYEVKIVKEAK